MRKKESRYKFKNLIFLVLIFLVVIAIILVLNYTKKAQLTGELILYTSVPTDTINKVKAEFKKRQPGIELNIFRSGTGKVMDRIYNEIDEGQIQADLIWVADFTVGEELKNKGQLLKYKSPHVDNIISFLKDKDDYYYAARLLNMIIAYNTDNVKKVPKYYRNLLNPEYKGKIGLADPSYSGAALYTVVTLAQTEEYGWDYFVRLYENETQIVKGNTSLIQAIADGELDMGITIDFMVRDLKNKNPGTPIDYIFPEEGVVLVPSPIAITKDCQNLLAAKVFVDFILSKEGQEFLSAQGITPVRLDVTPPTGVPTITQMKVTPSNPKEILIVKEDSENIFTDIFQGKQVEGTTEKTAILYTSVPITIIEELRYEFESQNPGIYLKIYRASTGKVVEKIYKEIEENLIQADLIWVANFAVAEELNKKGVLLSYIPPEAEEILNNLKDKVGYYTAGRLLIMVVAYNTDKVTIKPTGYEDLLNKKYQNKIGHDTPETSGSLLYFMGTLLQDKDFGEDFFKKLKENLPQIQTSTQTTKRIADGELDMGITIDFTVRKLLKENPDAPIDYIYPNDGVVLVPSPIAIFKDIPHPQAAILFVRYILSKRGQTLLRDLGGFMPVRLDVNPPERITSITQLKVIPSDKEWIMEQKDYIITKFIEIYGLPNN
jgi:iron(III) transport system substrate-binding protein